MDSGRPGDAYTYDYENACPVHGNPGKHASA
jgi:hypothetical protein